MIQEIRNTSTFKVVYIPWGEESLRGRLIAIDEDDLVSSSKLLGQLNLASSAVIVARQDHTVVARKHFPDLTLVELMDSFPPPGMGTGKSPLQDIYYVFRALKAGHDVVTVEANRKICGLLPAALSILSDPKAHIEKVLYPINREGYELAAQHVAYLYGLWDVFWYKGDGEVGTSN